LNVLRLFEQPIDVLILNMPSFDPMILANSSIITFVNFLVRHKELTLWLAKNKVARRLVVFLICILAVILYRNLGKSLLTDRYIHGNPFAVGVGYKESHLANEIISIKNLATNTGISDFKISTVIISDAEKYQRIIEFLYPLRENGTSHFLFSLSTEKITIDCHELGRDQAVILYKCK